MATLPLVPAQIETTFQTVTIAMLGLPVPQSDNDPAYSAVRIEWPTDGQPFNDITHDVVYLRCVEDDDQYDRIRDRNYEDEQDADGNAITTEFVQYTRVWRVFWDVYGPNSFESTRKIRSALLTQAIHDQLAQSMLYLVTTPSAPQRVPEYKDGQWWQRVNFSAQFNENTVESSVVGTVASAEVQISTQDGVIADLEMETI